jgi:putative restriction endonuclease
LEIHKRPSRGRGEYELAGTHGSIKLKDLYGKEIVINADIFGQIATGVQLISQGGKPRLRRISGTGIHIARQLEALLLLPKSIREERQLVGGQPIVLENRYVLRRMEISKLSVAASRATATFGKIDCINDSGTEEIDCAKRFRDIRKIYDRLTALPADIANLLTTHRSAILATGTVGSTSEKTVSELMEATERAASDYEKPIIPGSDPVPFLLEVAEIPPVAEPPQVEEIDPSDIAIRRGAAERWRQFKDRGPEGAKFRRAVRQAYKFTCIVCGLKLPAAPGLKIAGVDAAHILPWAKYDADIVPNGLCLCRHHHWAFDQLLIAIHPTDDGEYRVVVTSVAEKSFAGNDEALADLKKHEGIVSGNRLPLDRNLWPSPTLLKKFYEDVGISF